MASGASEAGLAGHGRWKTSACDALRIARLLSWTILPYPAGSRQFLLHLASGGNATAADTARAGALIAEYSVRTSVRLSRLARVPLERIAFIGTHGHTLYHAPANGMTFQAGDLSRIAEETGVTVVGDFRSRDVAAGGQGAPLAPFAHHALFAHSKENRIILNLGGIANVTWLAAGRGPSSVLAFDTGPANMIMDALAERHYRGRRSRPSFAFGNARGRLNCDVGGRLAERGRVAPRILARLLEHPYFRHRPPKSTGREEFGAAILPVFRRLSAPDALATAAEFTAASVAGQIARWLPAASRTAVVYAGGGGARNPALMRRLAAALAPRRLRPLAVLGFPEQAVEPVCFALLGWARLAGRNNVLRRVTGARRAVCAGVIVPGR